MPPRHLAVERLSALVISNLASDLRQVPGEMTTPRGQFAGPPDACQGLVLVTKYLLCQTEPEMQVCAHRRRTYTIEVSTKL